MKCESPEMGYSKSTSRNILITTKKNVVLNLSYSAQITFYYRFKYSQTQPSQVSLLDNSSKIFLEILEEKCFGKVFLLIKLQAYCIE